MATNGRPPSRPPPPMSRPPGVRPVQFGPSPTGPPPSIAPPPIPNSPAGSRKLSLQPQGLYSRQPEPIEQNRQFKFGDTKLRSPSPSRNATSRNGTVERKVSAPPMMSYSVTSPVPFNTNGSNQDMASMMGLLEHEETDFVEQVKKSKAFIQSVIRDKEELAGLVASHQNKIHKLEGERMEYQKKIIEAERDRRNFQVKLEQEQVSSAQTLKQIEVQRNEYDNLQRDANTVTNERNDAVARLGQEMAHLEKLERDKREMMSRLDNMTKDQEGRNASMDIGKNVSDLNMKLKLEIGALRGENEGLHKKNDEVLREVADLETQIQVTGRNLRARDGELQTAQASMNSLEEEAARLKKQLDSAQTNLLTPYPAPEAPHTWGPPPPWQQPEEAKHHSGSESQAKVENSQLKAEYVAATDRIQKLQNEIHRIEADKKDSLNKIQTMHSEMKDLRRTLEDFEANKSSEIRSLETSLTKSLSANKVVNDKFVKEQNIVASMEQSNSDLKGQIERLEIDNRKQQESAKSYLEVIKNKKKVEEELLDTIREIKEKVEKYEGEKKNLAQAERLRKSSVATQDKAEKKEWEEKMEKVKLQFDKAAVESKKNINKLQEENDKATSLIEEIRTDLEKKQLECRTLTNKLNLMEKEFARYKAQSKEEIDRNEKTMEEMEGKISEGRRNAESWKRKHDSVQTDLESTIKEKYTLEAQIEQLKDDIGSLKETHADEETEQRVEKSKVEAKLRDANIKIRHLETEKAELKKKSEDQIQDLSSQLSTLKNDLKKSTLEKENLSKKIDRLAGEKHSALEGEIEAREKTIAEKEAEIGDLKQVSEIKEKKLKCDIEREAEEKNKVTKKLNSEIETMKTDVSKKENQIGKLEKEKRDISITQDKSKKKINDIESEMTKLKEVLTRLEGEKKTNNFGKYEREKMQLEIGNLTTEKHSASDRLEALNREKYELNQQIKNLSKLEVVKSELSGKNDELDATVLDLKNKCKDLEGTLKKEKDATKNKEKTLSEQLRLITNEKDKLQDKIDELVDSFKGHEKELTKMKSELGTAKNDLLEKDKQCKGMQKDDNKSKALTDRISLLEKQKYELDTKTRCLESEKSGLSKKVSDLEREKEVINKKLEEVEGKSSSSNDKKAKEDVSKLQKENQSLKKEKDDLGKSMKEIEKNLKKNIKDVKPNKVQGELKKLAEKIENNSLLSNAGAPYMNGGDASASVDAGSLKENFDALQKDFESRTGEIERLTSQLSRAKADSNSAVEKLRKSESELSQIKEKNAQLSDELLNKSRVIVGMENGGQNGGQDTSHMQKQVDDLKKKLTEAQGGKVKKSVRFGVEPEVTEPTKSVKELEDALDAAYRERNDIINQCKREVEFHRTIAVELENSIMEDFEWKLHEMEKDYHSKLKYSKETVDEQIKEACRGILKEKDDEINKLGIKLRKDMDKKLEKEKEELASALASVKGGSNEAVIEVFKKEKDAEISTKQKKWEEKRKKYHREIEDLKTKLKEKDTEVHQKLAGAQSSTDNSVMEERRKQERSNTKAHEDMEKLKDDLTGQITRLRAEYDEKITDYEARLQKALCEKVEKMMEMRDEVEVEYADKMEDLRNMYREEMNNQVSNAEKEKTKMQSLEKSLQDSLKSKRQEFDDIKAKYDESYSKVADLERRLDNQTNEVIRLSAELESYEYE